MPRVVIIGYGSPLRGDDAFGGLAADLVARHPVEGLVVIVAHQLGPEHAATLSGADHAVFLDAAITGEPGTLRAAAVVAADISPTAITHHLSPGNLLAIARMAYGSAPEATIITAAARTFVHGAEPSAEIRAAARTAADLVIALAERGRLHTETVCAALPAPQ